MEAPLRLTIPICLLVRRCRGYIRAETPRKISYFNTKALLKPSAEEWKLLCPPYQFVCLCAGAEDFCAEISWKISYLNTKALLKPSAEGWQVHYTPPYQFVCLCAGAEDIRAEMPRKISYFNTQVDDDSEHASLSAKISIEILLVGSSRNYGLSDM
jgi:hypothetical protein